MAKRRYSDDERKQAYALKLEKGRLYRRNKALEKKLKLEAKKDQLWNKYCSYNNKAAFFAIHIKSDISNFIEL